MYSVGVAFKMGVICRSCRHEVEVQAEYVRGLRTTQMAAALYTPVKSHVPEFVNLEWLETLTCENPDCGETYRYNGNDLLLYED